MKVKKKMLRKMNNNTNNDDYVMGQWDQYFDEMLVTPSGFCVYRAGNEGPFCLLLHGAGHTSLSWAMVAGQLKQHCRVIAYDFRGHGGSRNLSCEDMSSSVLVNDTKTVLNELFPEGLPKIAVIGHSMGGAIAVRTSLEIPDFVSCIIVLDVVEGTAMEALPMMKSILRQRPKSFESLTEAIRWSLSSGNVQNSVSAGISIPSQVVERDGQFHWITDLEQTAPFWKGWFENMSNLFLQVPAPKLLVIADTDRLDTPLTIAQMQGKYQLSIFPSVGHQIQEDDPDRTATTIITFLRRFKLIE